MEKMQYEVPALKELEKVFELVYGGNMPVTGGSPEGNPDETNLEGI